MARSMVLSMVPLVVASTMSVVSYGGYNPSMFFLLVTDATDARGILSPIDCSSLGISFIDIVVFLTP